MSPPTRKNRRIASGLAFVVHKHKALKLHLIPANTEVAEISTQNGATILMIYDPVASCDSEQCNGPRTSTERDQSCRLTSRHFFRDGRRIVRR
jgi:hypothetical protein